MKHQPFYQTTAKFIAALMIVMLVLAAVPGTPARAVLNGDFTTTNVLCDPRAVMVDSSTTCTATVMGYLPNSPPPMRGADPTAPTPTGTVSWTTIDVGTFAPSSCTLSGSGDSASCSVTYTPTSAGTYGMHNITATYAGDTTYETSHGHDYIFIVPWLKSLSPDSAAEGDDAFTLHVYGTGFFDDRSDHVINGPYRNYVGFGFYNGSIVCWNGEPRTTTFVDETELEAYIPAEDIISAHEVPFVTVFNPILVSADINTGPTFGTPPPCGYEIIGKAAIPAADIISASDVPDLLHMISNALPFFITFTGAAVTGFDMDTGDDPSATFEGITANATGNGTLVVAQYAENPASGTLFGFDDQYFDVHAATGNTFTQVTFQVCGVGARETLIIFWDGSEWVPASNQSVGPGDCVTIVVNDTTLPNLEQLAGALIAQVGVGGGGRPFFLDVPGTHWARYWIFRLSQAGITNGCGIRLYCPEGNVTRAEMAKFLLKGRHGSIYLPPAATAVFSDVPTTYWAADWIVQLYQEGLSTGCATDPLRYCPGSNVTRAEMAKFLLLAKYGSTYTPPAVGLSTGFADVPAGYWAAAWIKQLAVEGITTLPADGNYLPEAPVTRAEMAKFLVITFNLP